MSLLNLAFLKILNWRYKKDSNKRKNNLWIKLWIIIKRPVKNYYKLLILNNFILI